MGTTERIIQAQLDCDYYEDKQPNFIVGLARRAVDEGFDSLSEKQKAVLASHLTQCCDGVVNPGGHHNDCRTVLEGDDLASALDSQNYYDALLCPACMDESEGYAAEWDEVKDK